MASESIKHQMTIHKAKDNELVNVGSVIKPALISSSNLIGVTITRYGRTAGLLTNGTSLFGLTGGAKLNFGSDDSTITLTGNNSDGFTITSSIGSSLANVYLSIYEFVP